MRYRYNVFFLVYFVCSLIACKQEEKPEVLPMDEEKVITLLGDLHFAKSASKIYKKEQRDSILALYEAQVFEINKVSREEYLQLMQVLESDMNLYYDIEKKVHAHLKSIQNKKS